MSVVEWLESPEGEAWSRRRHSMPNGGWLLVCVKADVHYDSDMPLAFVWYA